MGKIPSSPEPAKADVTESVPVASASGDRVARIESIVARIESLPQPDAQTVLDDEAGNLSAFLTEGHNLGQLETKIKALLK